MLIEEFPDITWICLGIFPEDPSDGLVDEELMGIRIGQDGLLKEGFIHLVPVLKLKENADPSKPDAVLPDETSQPFLDFLVPDGHRPEDRGPNGVDGIPPWLDEGQVPYLLKVKKGKAILELHKNSQGDIFVFPLLHVVEGLHVFEGNRLEPFHVFPDQFSALWRLDSKVRELVSHVVFHPDAVLFIPVTFQYPDQIALHTSIPDIFNND